MGAKRQAFRMAACNERGKSFYGGPIAGFAPIRQCVVWTPRLPLPMGDKVIGDGCHPVVVAPWNSDDDGSIRGNAG
jgi:hypothetical protein